MRPLHFRSRTALPRFERLVGPRVALALLTSTLLFSCAFSAPVAESTQAFQTWAATPPMGWNSWDCFATTVTEAQTRANADVMAKKLARFGYNIITVDIQWYEPNATGFDYRKDAKLEIDPFGRLIPARNKFPSASDSRGFKPLADYVHSLGLKFGLHLMRGIPREAVANKTPIKGTHYTAADIADMRSTCPWNTDMYGVNMAKPGAQEYYDSVFELFATWGLDFVKVDDLSAPYHRPEIEAIRRAIDRTGRKIILSTSPGPTPLMDGVHVSTHANLWRISGDFWDEWSQLFAQFDRLRDWTPFRGPGHFPDADMLPLGTLQMGKSQTRFTPDEQVTLLTLWSIARSPLILGADLTKLDDATLALITNDEVIAVDQTSTNNRELFRHDGFYAWIADVPSSPDKYVAVFNTRSVKGDVEPRFARYQSPTITRRWRGKGVNIDIGLNGSKKLYLVVDDGHGGDGGDDVVWSEPTVTTEKGVTKLTDLKWTSATSGPKTAVSIAQSASGKALVVNGKPVAFGIAAHAKSVIEFDLPEGATRFKAFAGIDDGGAPLPEGPGPGPTVRFLVFTQSPYATDVGSEIPVRLAACGFTENADARDLWQKKDLGPVKNGELKPMVKAHSAVLYRLSPPK
ncbi:MAG: NPCBM/NEW2 domain-containing protein [Lacunisphaera sp.]